MTNLNTLEQCLKADLKLLPTYQEYSLSDTVIQVKVAEELYKECEANLKESKYESNRLLQCTSCQALVLHQNKIINGRKSQHTEGNTQTMDFFQLVKVACL